MGRTLAAFSAVILGACNFTPVGPGLELVDGCYYLESQPVLRVEGNQAELLIPSDVGTVAVDTAKDRNASQAIFSPGFDLLKGPPLRAKMNARFPKTYYMMDPFSSVPTILFPGESKDLIPLKRGSAC